MNIDQVTPDLLYLHFMLTQAWHSVEPMTKAVAIALCIRLVFPCFHNSKPKG